MISLGKQIFDSMKRYSSMCALKIGSRKISYDELNNKALSIAGFLSNQGVVNQNVGIVTQRSMSAYAGILGTIYAGCAYVPINSKYPKERISDIVKQAEINVLVGDESDWVVIRDKIHNIDGIQYILFPEAREFHIENSLIGVFENQFANFKILSEPLKTEDNENAYIMFTSGSTGKPKGVQVTGMNVMALLNNMKQVFRLKPGFKASQTFDLCFDLSISDMFFTWSNGGTLCVLPEHELSCPAEYIVREKIDFWHSVPTLAEFMKKLGYLQKGMYESLKYSIFCGEPLTQEIANAWLLAAPNSKVENYFGPTETTVFVSRYNYTETESARKFHNDIVPIGKPFADHQMVLIDEENNIAGEKDFGEIAISGAQVSKGYLNDSEKTQYVFVRMPWDSSGSIWYKTGDMAKYNDSGNMEYISRKDNQIKIAGRRIEIGEIESLLKGKIKEGCTIVPKRNESGIVTSLAAFVNIKLTDDDIMRLSESCKGSIESLFFPNKFLFLEEIPTTISGKVDRKLLEKIATSAKH